MIKNDITYNNLTQKIEGRLCPSLDKFFNNGYPLTLEGNYENDESTKSLMISIDTCTNRSDAYGNKESCKTQEEIDDFMSNTIFEFRIRYLNSNNIDDLKNTKNSGQENVQIVQERLIK